MSQERIERYNTCAKICKGVYKKLKDIILQEKKSELNELCKYGDEMIRQRCKDIQTNCLDKGVWYPVSISLNNCVGGYIYESNGSTVNYKNKIEIGDVVKIDLGVYIGDAHVMFGDTFILNNKKEPNNNTHHDENNRQNYLILLERLKERIKDHIKPGNINDDVKMYIESSCSELDCVPVENCISRQQLQENSETDEAKVIILNYQKYYDEDDRLILPNYCYEFEEGEIYDINLTIVKGERSNGKVKHNPHIYRFNNYFYDLRLKASRDFLKQCKSKNGTNYFRIDEWNCNPKWRMGIKECVNGGILEECPVLYESENNLVFTKKFTVMVTETRCIIFG